MTIFCVACSRRSRAAPLRHGLEPRLGSHHRVPRGQLARAPILTPFAIGSILAFGIHKIRGRVQRRGIAGITLPAFRTLPGATTIYGNARKFRATVTSVVDAAEVLVEHAVVKDRAYAVLLRRTESAPFFIDTLDGGPVLVTGVTRVSSPTFLAHRQRVERGDPQLHRMGVPDDLAICAISSSPVISRGRCSP